MFHIHKWGLWATTYAEMLRGHRMVILALQYRTCSKCGSTQVK